VDVLRVPALQEAGIALRLQVQDAEPQNAQAPCQQAAGDVLPRYYFFFVINEKAYKDGKE
jgi:hypothetical protein